MVRHHLGLKQPQEGRQRAYSAFSEVWTPRKVCRVLKTPLRAFLRLARSRLALRLDTWFHTPRAGSKKGGPTRGPLNIAGRCPLREVKRGPREEWPGAIIDGQRGDPTPTEAVSRARSGTGWGGAARSRRRGHGQPGRTLYTGVSDPTLPRVEQGVKAGGHPLLPEDQTRPFGPRQGGAESSLPSAGTDHPDTWFHTPGTFPLTFITVITIITIITVITLQ